MKEENKNCIIDFYSRELSEQEKIKFLEKASSDKGFVKELVRMTELNEAFEKVYGFREKRSIKSRAKIIFMIPLVITAAALIIFGLFFGIQKSQFNNNPGDSLFSEFYEPFDISLTRSAENIFHSSNNSISFIRIYTLYVYREYDKLININYESINFEDVKDYIYLMQGISAIEVKDFSKARLVLSSIGVESNCSSAAQWYLLLLSVKENRFDNVIPVLDDYATNNLIFMDKAIALKAKIIKHNLVN